MDLESYKVLMIDDDEMIATEDRPHSSESFGQRAQDSASCRILKRQLSPWQAGRLSYADAVAFLEKCDVSLLLLDINLGEKSGFDLCRKIREKFLLFLFLLPQEYKQNNHDKQDNRQPHKAANPN